MASITLKDIPPDLHEELKRSALENGRSLSKEILLRLRMARLRGGAADAARLLVEVRRVRRLFAGRSFDPAEIDRAKRQGRR